MKQLIILFCMALSSSLSYAQCNVKTNYRPGGIVVKYLNPELVGKGADCELGLSVQTNGSDYFISTTVRYLSNASKVTGDLKIQLSNNQSLVLDLFSSELATVRNEKIGLGVYFLKEVDIIKLKSSNIKTVVFKETSGLNQIVVLNQNHDLAKRHLTCLQNQK